MAAELKTYEKELLALLEGLKCAKISKLMTTGTPDDYAFLGSAIAHCGTASDKLRKQLEETQRELKVQKEIKEAEKKILIKEIQRRVKIQDALEVASDALTNLPNPWVSDLNDWENWRRNFQLPAEAVIKEAGI